MSDIREKEVGSVSGIPFLFVLLVLLALVGLNFAGVFGGTKVTRILSMVLGLPIFLLGISGLYKVECALTIRFILRKKYPCGCVILRAAN